MAVAVITVVKNSENVNGKHREIMLDIVGPTTYATGGIPITPTRCGMKTILGIFIIGGNGVAALFLSEWINSTNKLLVSNPTSGVAGAATEIANGTNLSTSTWRVNVVGF